MSSDASSVREQVKQEPCRKFLDAVGAYESPLAWRKDKRIGLFNLGGQLIPELRRSIF